MSNVSAVTNHFPTANEGFITTLGGSILASAATVPLTSVSGLTNGTIFVGIIEPGQAKQQTFTGVVDTAGVQITGVKWTRGTDVDHTAGVTIVDYVSGTGNNMITKGILKHANQDGTLITQAVRDALSLGTSSTSGWEVGSLPNISSVVANGNRSYTLTHASSIASIITPGFRRRFTRTVAAPTQCTSLNGTNQYYNKTSPSGMTFTDNFTTAAWVKLSSYPTGQGNIISRRDAGNGFALRISTSGQLETVVLNATNNRVISTFQSLPLNKWVHVAATNAVNSGQYATFIDGIQVPNTAASSGSMTTIAQAGVLEVGSAITTNLFPGKIAQVAVFNAVLSQATIIGYMTRGLLGTETNLISAYSFNNAITDLNTTNANNLTAQGSAVATNADSPFGNNGVSSTLEYGLTMSVSADGLTEVVQCPEGCALPTTGGITASAYSTMANPYGWVSDKGRWELSTLVYSQVSTSGTSTSTVYNPGGLNITMGAGSWSLQPNLTVGVGTNAAGADISVGISTSNSSFTIMELSTRLRIVQNATTSDQIFIFTRTHPVTNTTMTPYYINLYSLGAFSALYVYGASGLFTMSKLVAIPSGL